MTIIVRAMQETDFAAIGEINGHETVYRQSATLPHRRDTFWAARYSDRDKNGAELVAEVDGKVVGHLSVVTNANARTRHVASFGIGVHPDHHGKGVGRALMTEMIRICDNYLNIVRLELVCHTDNLGAIALYEKFGFEREGIARYDIFTEGTYKHGLHMSRINPNYLPILGAG